MQKVKEDEHMATLIRTDRNGTKYFTGMVTCPRCGGAGGADAWKATGWTCYECGGDGKVRGTLLNIVLIVSIAAVTISTIVATTV